LLSLAPALGLSLRREHYGQALRALAEGAGVGDALDLRLVHGHLLAAAGAKATAVQPAVGLRVRQVAVRRAIPRAGPPGSVAPSWRMTDSAAAGWRACLSPWALALW
jgi:hypothetical protein